MPKQSHSCRNRAALSAAAAVIAPAMYRVSLAMTPDRPAFDPGERGHHLAGETRPQERHRPLVGQRLDDRADVVGAPVTLGNHCAQGGLVAGVAAGRRSLEVAEQPLGDGDRFRLVGDDDVDDAVGLLHRDRADLVGVDVAEPAAGDHRGPAHADRRVPGGHDQVGGPRDHGVAREAATLDDRDARHQTRQLRPQLERARLERRHRRVVGVARSAAAAFGEEHGRQPHPLDELEQPVFLAVPEVALGARPARCSRRTARRGAASSPKSSPLMRAVPATSPSAGVRAIRSSRSRRNLWAAIANRPYSTNEPGSTRSSMFSRAVRPFVARLRSTASGRAASSVSARRRNSSAWSSRIGLMLAVQLDDRRLVSHGAEPNNEVVRPITFS